ncbi:MAG: aminoglycoside phosphotransferase family protein [candidate division KSB1 bacterium]|nr:aminoglycoside phosphotransferase family protein [candidate division KSB1 bacterium]
MLETTLNTEFLPGTNLTGGLACAAWRFLLPSLRAEKILCLGVPSISTLTVLSKMSHETRVISTDAGKLEKIRVELEQLAIANVRAIHLKAFTQLPEPDRSLSLILLLGEEKKPSRMLRDPALLAEVDRVLKDDGVIYFEIKKLFDRFAALKAFKKFSALGFKTARHFWLTPFSGELRTAFPLDDEAMAESLFKNVLYGQSFKMRAISRAGVLLSRTGVLKYLVPRRAALMSRSQTGENSQPPPEYLIALAKNAGVDLAGFRCGLSARGKYNANKTIFYLFGNNRQRAEAVVKMTRAPEFNARLENEYRVLSVLKEKGFAAPGTFPEPLFFGYHENLAILGQKAVHGAPFRSRTRATADCPIARDAIEWIVKLGVASAPKLTATPAQVGEALMKLFRRFAQIYPLASFEHEFLVTQIKRMSCKSTYIPVVFQHGDPGTWNMLVSEQGHVIVIDWEAGEMQGMPLWDLFYFMRTYGSWMARIQGNTDPLENFARSFLQPSALSALLAKTVERYCNAIGLDEKLIEPLFYTCWMHRALKESTRLTEASLEKGHYFNLLRRCIEQRQTPALSSLFSLRRNGHARQLAEPSVIATHELHS